MANWLTSFAGSQRDGKARTRGFAIHTGLVTSNFDLLNQGKILVHLPDLGLDIWARLCAPGAGAKTGLYFSPNPDDEVLVAFDLNDPSNGFVLGGLWATTAPPPIPTALSEKSTRIFRTGMTSAVGHEVEFDDLKQSITIKTSTGQKVAMTVDAIEVSTTGGTMSIKMDLTSQSISITAPLNISLEAKGEVKISGTKVSISGTATTDIQGGIVTIN